MKRVFLLSLIIILAFTFVACGSIETPSVKESTENVTNTDSTVYPLRITDSFGREVVIESEPKRVISAGPNITETIFALEAQEKLIARTDYCNYPKEVENIKESIGKITEPSIEKIVDLEPDLVIASTHFSEEVIKKLEELDIKIVVLYGEESFEGVYNIVTKVGQVLNRKEKAQQIVSVMQEKVSNIINKVKDKEKPSVYYVLDFGEYGDYTAGKGTFISKMINMAGGNNVADDVEGWKYNLEKLVEKDPDILICSDKNNAKAGIIKANGYRDLTAVKNSKLFEIDNNLLDRQGPRLVEGLEQLAKIIHPELFK